MCVKIVCKMINLRFFLYYTGGSHKIAHRPLQHVYIIPRENVVCHARAQEVCYIYRWAFLSLFSLIPDTVSPTLARSIHGWPGETVSFSACTTNYRHTTHATLEPVSAHQHTHTTTALSPFGGWGNSCAFTVRGESLSAFSVTSHDEGVAPPIPFWGTFTFTPPEPLHIGDTGAATMHPLVEREL